jgi:ubiquinone/menaquinone biosynthesis C-methylase UbiE
VFSKDALLHVPDKDALFAEIFRVLKPGGVFAASNWMTSHDGEPSPDMKAYVAAEGLSRVEAGYGGIVGNVEHDGTDESCSARKAIPGHFRKERTGKTWPQGIEGSQAAAAD